MKSVRFNTVLDDSGEVRIPVPAELHSGESVEIEVFFHNRSGKSTKSWSDLLDSVEGIFEEYPLELPHDPPPEPVYFEQ